MYRYLTPNFNIDFLSLKKCRDSRKWNWGDDLNQSSPLILRSRGQYSWWVTICAVIMPPATSDLSSKCISHRFTSWKQQYDTSVSISSYLVNPPWLTWTQWYLESNLNYDPILSSPLYPMHCNALTHSKFRNSGIVTNVKF